MRSPEARRASIARASSQRLTNLAPAIRSSCRKVSYGIGGSAVSRSLGHRRQKGRRWASGTPKPSFARALQEATARVRRYSARARERQFVPEQHRSTLPRRLPRAYGSAREVACSGRRCRRCRSVALASRVRAAHVRASQSLARGGRSAAAPCADGRRACRYCRSAWSTPHRPPLCMSGTRAVASRVPREATTAACPDRGAPFGAVG